MVKTIPPTTKGEQTQEQIFQAALSLFRENGFDVTTMQQVAERAGVAKGAAYYYFPSKEAIIQAYYERTQVAQEQVCAGQFRTLKRLRDRLALVFQSKFDSVADDRKLLGVVFRYTGEPEHPLSCLGAGTADVRRRSIEVFREALSVERLPPDLALLLPLALWSMQMGLLVMFLYDNSTDQRRTRRLTEGALDFTLKMLSLAKLPLLEPVRSKALALLKDAELLPGLASPATSPANSELE